MNANYNEKNLKREIGSQNTKIQKLTEENKKLKAIIVQLGKQQPENYRQHVELLETQLKEKTESEKQLKDDLTKKDYEINQIQTEYITYRNGYEFLSQQYQSLQQQFNQLNQQSQSTQFNDTSSLQNIVLYFEQLYQYHLQFIDASLQSEFQQ